jgi:hypothetical protein
MVEFLRGSPTGEDTVTWWNSRWRFEEAGKGKDRKFRLFACDGTPGYADASNIVKINGKRVS